MLKKFFLQERQVLTVKEIMRYTTENIIPSTLELGGKSPNVFFKSIMDADDEFFDKAIEGYYLHLIVERFVLVHQEL